MKNMKHILIVGGSKGIGNAILKQQLDSGNKIMNISRTVPGISHSNLEHHNLDILDNELPEIDTLDTIVYCPGSINLKPISRLSMDDFQRDFNVNVLGAVKTIKTYLPSLKKGHSPSILLFSSVAAKLGMPFHASVATAKAAIEGLTKSLGAELAPNIRVNAIAPTVTDTALAEKLLRNDKMKEMITERHPLKKYLEPKEVANMADFLVSEKAASISGQIIEMDCGIVSFKL